MANQAKDTKKPVPTKSKQTDDQPGPASQKQPQIPVAPPPPSTSANPNNPGSNNFISNPLILIWQGATKMFERNSNITIGLMITMFVITMAFTFVRFFSGAMASYDTSHSYNRVPDDLGRLLIVVAIASIISLVFMVIINAMSYLIGIQSSKDKAHSFDEYFHHTLRHFWRLIGFYIIYIIMIAVGLVLFVVPGIYLMYIFSLTPLVILDQNKGVFDSMGESSRLVKNLFWEWLGFTTSSMLINGFIGWAVSVPVSGSFGLFYLQAKAIKENKLQKMPTHWTNYVIPAGVIGLFGLLLIIMIFIGVVIASGL